MSSVTCRPKSDRVLQGSAIIDDHRPWGRRQINFVGLGGGGAENVFCISVTQRGSYEPPTCHPVIISTKLFYLLTKRFF